jgi:hypothetical protein
MDHLSKKLAHVIVSFYKVFKKVKHFYKIKFLASIRVYLIIPLNRIKSREYYYIKAIL